DMGDLFALQNEITGRIAVALNFKLADAEAGRTTDNPDALDYIFRARAALAKGASRENYADAIGLFERALALDPGSVEAQSRLAAQLVGRVLNGMADPDGPDIPRAEALIGQSLAASPLDPVAHFAKGLVLRVQGRPEQAILEFETVL